MRYLILSCCFLFFVGCSSSKVFVDPQYTSSNCSDRTLTLLPLPLNGIAVTNDDDVRDDFRNDHRPAAQVLKDSCYLTMFRALPEYLSGIQLDRTELVSGRNDGSDCSKALSYTVGKDNIPLEFDLPTEKCVGKKVDIGLLISGLVFSRSNGSSGTMMGGGGMMVGGSSASLQTDITFLVYDYKNNQPVAYGKTKASSSFMFGMTHGTWTSEFRHIINEVIKKTPFRASSF